MSEKPTLPPINRRPVGELYVWFTGLGLVAGLMMIAASIGIIVYHGLEAFWPKTAYTFNLEDKSPEPEENVFYAQIIREVMPAHQGEGEQAMEYQVFTGSKEIFGQAFRYIRENDITSKDKDSAILEIERLTGGKALVRPLAIEKQSGETVSADSLSFKNDLKELTHEAASNRDEITRIQKKEIGSINSHLEKLGRDLKALEMSYDFQENGHELSALPREKMIMPVSDPVEAWNKLTERKNELQSEYESHMAQIRNLKENEDKNFLVYSLGGKRTGRISMDQIYHYTPVNDLGVWGKLKVFFNRIWNFVSEDPREANTEGGVFPAIFGTFVMTILMSALVTPIGVIAAIYLREYARQGLLVNTVRICVNNLAGVPSIVFGVFGLGFFVYFVGGGIDELFFSRKLEVSQSPTFGTSGVLWASLTLALMTLPVVIVATEESLAAVPRGLREAALACGASKWQMIQRIILPNALPGVLTGIILAMARGAGEVAPLMMTGVVKLAPDLPIDLEFPYIHLERKFMHLGFHIYDVGFQSPDSDAARSMVFATTLLLILLVIVMNLTAILIRNKLRKRHQTSSF